MINTKDFSLHSGERQTAQTLDEIRKDHIYRYDMIKQFIEAKCTKKKQLNIADIFCGNGYGSFIMGSIPNVVVFGIDGSHEAIELASKYFTRENVFFSQKFFPFRLPEKKFDIVCSIESIEHIQEDIEFSKELIKSISDEGYLIVSTPNSKQISLEINQNKFHFRHYEVSEVQKMFKDLDLISFYGQNTYVINQQGAITGNLADSEMILKENIEGQFNICIFRKKKKGFKEIFLKLFK